jgi:hypothetical protein
MMEGCANEALLTGDTTCVFLHPHMYKGYLVDGILFEMDNLG